MKKKLISVLLVCVMLLGVMPVYAANTGSFGIEVKDVTSGTSAKTAAMTVACTSNSGVAGVEFDITYDTDLTLTKITNSSKVFKTGTFTVNKDEPGYARVVWYNESTNVTTTGDLFTLTFDVTGAYQRGYDVTVQTVDPVALSSTAERVDLSTSQDTGTLTVNSKYAKSAIVLSSLIWDTWDSDHDYDGDIPYTGSQQSMPEFWLYDENWSWVGDLVEGVDYTVSGTTKATNVGDYEVTFTGIGLYTGTIKATWGIKYEFTNVSSDATINVSMDGAWTDLPSITGTIQSGQKVSAVYSYAGTPNDLIVLDSDQSKVRYNENGTDNEDNPPMRLRANLSAKDYLSVYRTVTINLLKAAAQAVTGDAVKIRYNDKATTLRASDVAALDDFKDVQFVSASVTSGSEYLTASCSDGTVTIAPKSGLSAPPDEGYDATLSITFSNRSCEDSTLTLPIHIMDKNPVDTSKLTFKDGSATYTGAAQKYEKATKKSPLKGSFTYTYWKDGVQVSEMKDAGTYTVVATYDDADSTGKVEAKFTIKPATLTISKATANPVEYSGSIEVDPSVITDVTFKGLKGNDTLTNSDYEVTNPTLSKAAIGNQKVTFTVQLTGEGASKNYTLTKTTGTTTIGVTGTKLENVKVELTGSEDGFTYTGSAQKPAVKVTNADGTVVVPTSDYTVAYKDNTKASTDTSFATVTVTAKKTAGYTFDPQVVTFEIQKATPTLTTKALSVNWTGAALEDKVIKGTAKVGTKTVSGSWSWVDQPSTDVSHDTPNVGTVRFTPKDSTNYTTAEAEINVTVKGTTLTISGAVVEPKSYDPGDDTPVISSVTFKSGKTVVDLKMGTDYTVTGSYVKYAVGKQKVNFTVALSDQGASANYTLTKPTGTTTGTITAPAVTISVEGLEDQNYTGKAITPNITVWGTDENDTRHELAKNTDYTVTYKNNKAVGTATVTIKPKGKNYSFETVTKTFDIVAPAPTEYEVTATDLQLTYTGVALTDKAIKGTVKLDGKAVSGSWKWETKPGTDAQTYQCSATFTPKDQNYAPVTNVPVRVKINPATLTAKVSAKPIKQEDVDAADLADYLTVTFSGLKNKETLTRGSGYTVTAAFANATDVIGKGTQTVSYTITVTDPNYILKTGNSVEDSTTIKVN